MTARTSIKIGLAVALSLCFSTAAHAQENPASREISSDDFGRPQSSSPAAKASTAKPARPAKTPAARLKPGSMSRQETYKLARVEPKVMRRKTTAQPRVKSGPKESLATEDVGVTLWRLRAPRATDSGPKISVQTADDRRELWTPERVSISTQFLAGERVRLAIESRQRGYLYVINNEMYAGGRLGKPFLLFPAPANKDETGRLLAQQFNQVRPGLLVDIPDQSEDLPYFKIEPKSPDYVGEMLILIVSPTPLEGLKLDGLEQEIQNVDLLAQWEEEWGTSVNLYTKDGGEGEAFTNVEQQAACGAKARQLVRQKPSIQTAELTPCGSQTRRLTREEPLPQSIYRASVAQGRPIVIPVRLAVRTRN
jgi:hypothetical protein